MVDGTRLTKLKVAEVSLVGMPANRRRFLLTKAMEGGGTAVKLSGECKAMMKACVRKMEPYRDQLEGLWNAMDCMTKGEMCDMSKMMPTSGDVNVPSTEWQKGIDEGKPIDELLREAWESGRQYERNRVDAMGKEGCDYSDGMMEAIFDACGAMKAYKSDLPEELFEAFRGYLGDDMFEIVMNPMKAMRKAIVVKGEGADESRNKSEELSIDKDQLITKGDDQSMEAEKKLDLTTLPPEVKEQIDQLFKSQEEAIKKAEALEAVLKEEKDKRLTEEALAIAKGFSHLSIKPEEFANVIKDLRATAPESWAEVEKALTAANKAVAEGKLFEELGSEARTGASTVMGKINAMADGIIQKSEVKLTREQAIDKILKDNPALYNEYLAELGQ